MKEYKSVKIKRFGEDYELTLEMLEKVVTRTITPIENPNGRVEILDWGLKLEGEEAEKFPNLRMILTNRDQL